jgi:hypothetical protein
MLFESKLFLVWISNDPQLTMIETSKSVPHDGWGVNITL